MNIYQVVIYFTV